MGIFSRTDQTGHKTCTNKYKNVDVISSTFSDNDGMKLEINSKKNFRNYANKWRLNNILFNKQRVIEEIRRKTKIH
jgi:hypothetical protein